MPAQRAAPTKMASLNKYHLIGASEQVPDSTQALAILMNGGPKPIPKPKSSPGPNKLRPIPKLWVELEDELAGDGGGDSGKPSAPVYRPPPPEEDDTEVVEATRPPGPQPKQQALTL